MGLVDYEKFSYDVDVLAVLKGWHLGDTEDATAKAINRLFMMFPKDAATKRPRIHEEQWEQAYNAVLDNPYAKAADLKGQYVALRLQSAQTAPADVPALPPAPDTRNLKNDKGGEEYVRFKRFHRQLVELRRQGKKNFGKDEYQRQWQAPLTVEDWALASNTDPAKAVSDAVGGTAWV